MAYDYYSIPEHLADELDQWLCHGIVPGGFLRAVLSNNLIDSIVRADLRSREALPRLVQFLLDQAPEGSFGRPSVLEDYPSYLRALERQAAQASWEDSQ